ncbi:MULTISPECIES: [protein-PII] uridylyltransferase [Protofrankia]|uniref:Bifunctional uridylyltransferase/uridylyl-removing enzyme n=1 Tax=Candidatus Protofrankia datiscae TaxID=2716812 RepID=F8B138_9ACTN|nr:MULTISPECIES: [protein-PII] uridylyltransferase [Protofrankia]AEH07672.1 UTP-GlnB uridylyltransferase, GlnD [Candidatus Protofrankia datiscae]
MTNRLAALTGRSEEFGGIVGPALRHALMGIADTTLRDLFGEPGPGVALLAVGGYGRGEPVLGSDLDLVLLHDGRRDDVTGIADTLWYPLWDAGIGLDHSVRTVDEAVAVADDDLKAALGLLTARPIAGDRVLVGSLLERVRARWRARSPHRLPELADLVADRARRHGDVAFLLEPDLKQARGGLRDVHALAALATAWAAETPPARVLEAHRVLLDARGEIRRLAHGRRQDRLLLQDQAAVAAALGYPDQLALAHATADAGRTISWTWDTTWYRVSAGLRSSARRRPGPPVRRPLDQDVVEQDGEAQLARDADPTRDPALVLRAAAAAARAGIPIGRYALNRLAREAPPMPAPWPDAARQALVALLATGPAMIGAMEALDQVGLLVRLLPEWEAVRSRPQRNPYHRFTVDRHLLETAAAAAASTREVDRPDLLLLGALLHDIGKGRPGDHTDVGVKIVHDLAPRLGLPPADADVLVTMVRQHLLLIEAATRRDIDDPATIEAVARAAGSPRILGLLHALTEADALATGPTAWSPWKARLVGDLVERAMAVHSGGRAPCPPALTDRQRALLTLPDDYHVAVNPLPDDSMFEIVVVAPDRPGLLAATTGVLAVNRLDVHRASARGENGRALLQAAVASTHDGGPSAGKLRGDLLRVLAGRVDLDARIAGREQAYAAARRRLPPAPPKIIFDDSGSDTVVEIRTPDRAGVLFRMVRALTDAGLGVRTAIVATIGLDVVNAFYVREADGSTVGRPGRREEVANRVLAALG